MIKREREGKVWHSLGAVSRKSGNIPDCLHLLSSFWTVWTQELAFSLPVPDFPRFHCHGVQQYLAERVEEERGASLWFSCPSQTHKRPCLEFRPMPSCVTCSLGDFSAPAELLWKSPNGISIHVCPSVEEGRDWKHSCSDNRLSETPQDHSL